MNILLLFREAPKRYHHRMSILKSAFAKKKHQVQYESRTHFKTMEVRQYCLTSHQSQYTYMYSTHTNVYTYPVLY